MNYLDCTCVPMHEMQAIGALFHLFALANCTGNSMRLCRDRSACVYQGGWCDGVDQCGDRSDEISCSSGKYE